MIHNKIVGNTSKPATELTFSRVTTLADGHHHLNEDILKEILYQLLIRDPVADSRMHIGIIAKKECIESIIVPRGVESDELVITHLGISSHIRLYISLHPYSARETQGEA